MDQLLQMIGEEALKTLPLAIAVWLCGLLFFSWAAYKVVSEESDTNTQLGVGAAFGVLILVWIGFGASTIEQTKEFCRDLRGTSQWSEQKCHTIDPEGSPFRQQPPF